MLEARRDALLAPVVDREGWSVEELVDVATGKRTIRPELREQVDPDRAELLSAILAVELARKRTKCELMEEIERTRRHALVSNSRLVAREARRFAFGGFLRFGDLFQEGFTGLMHASEKFDPYRGFAFSTYATAWVRQRIWRALDDQSRTVRIPVHVEERIRRVRTAQRDLSQGGRLPSLSAVAEAAEVDSASEVLRLTQLDQPSTPIPPEIVAAEARLDYEAGMDAAEWRTTVALHVNRLPPTLRLVVDRRYGLTDNKPLTLDGVGRLLGVTRERVRQVEEKAFNILRRELWSTVIGDVYTAEDGKRPKRTRDPATQTAPTRGLGPSPAAQLHQNGASRS